MAQRAAATETPVVSRLSQKFWSTVDRSGGPDACWPWLGGGLSNGYGQMKFEKKVMLTHRIAWVLIHGPIPETKDQRVQLCVCHHCDNPPCCNPAHLFLGTRTDNNRDMHRKNRYARGERSGAYTHPEKRCRGTKVWNAKLTEEMVRYIRASTGTQQAVATELGVSRGLIGVIRRGVGWKHVQ